jgi:hypothetical protein
MLAGLAACAVACGGASGPAGDASLVGPVGDAQSEAPSVGISCPVAEPDSGQVVIPVADRDAAGCSFSSYGCNVVCFGTDATPYRTYLTPDAGTDVGRCPAPRDFLPPRGEGAGGYAACGPLLPSATEAFLAEAGAHVGDGGEAWTCCFLVMEELPP